MLRMSLLKKTETNSQLSKLKSEWNGISRQFGQVCLLTLLRTSNEASREGHCLEKSKGDWQVAD